MFCNNTAIPMCARLRSSDLLPEAITVAASIVYPVDGDDHGKDANLDHRRNFEVEFLANGVKFAAAERPPYQAGYIPPRAGHYSFTARLRYGEGHRTLLSNAVAVVSDTPPSVSLTAPAANLAAYAPANITLSADAASQFGSIARVDFYAATSSGGSTVNTLLGSATTGTGGTYSYTWSNVAAGSYILTAVATDGYGYGTTSSPVAVTVKPGELQPYYIHTDQLDTPREITDTSANVVWQWDNQDPFGNNIPNENPSNQGVFKFNQRFPGQYYDTETNLAYNVNRDYDPAIGRYIQSDPIGLRGGINTYIYVRGNPLRWIDPYGLFDFILPDFLGGRIKLGGPSGEGTPGMVNIPPDPLNPNAPTSAPGVNFLFPAPVPTGGAISLPSPGSNANTPNSDAVPLPPPDSWPICQVTGTCMPESMGLTTPMSLPTTSTPINNTPTSTSSSCQ